MQHRGTWPGPPGRQAWAECYLASVPNGWEHFANSATGQAAEHASLVRAQECVRLRINEGLSWREIGERVGMTYSGARKLFLRHMEQLKAHTAEEFRVAQTMELLRLDGLWKLNYERATNEAIDSDVQQRATAVCLKISERRAKLLGIDSAERLELTGADGGPMSFNFTELSDEALDKEVSHYMKSEYMEGASDGYRLAMEQAEREALPPVQSDDVTMHEQPEDDPSRAKTDSTVLVQTSQGQARV